MMKMIPVQDKLDIALCAVAAREEIYIREWIEHYKQIGISHIYLGDNNKSDYKIPLQPIIQDYIDEGYVTLYNINDLNNYQQRFYSGIYFLHNIKHDYICFFDIDEFLVIDEYNSISDWILSNDKFNNFYGICVNWRLVDNNNEIEPKDITIPLQERYTKIDSFRANTIKTIVKCKNDFLHSMGAHYPNFKNIYTKENIDNNSNYLCDVYGDNIIQSKKGPHIDNFNTFSEYTDYYNKVYLKHFYKKSLYEWITYKLDDYTASSCTIKNPYGYHKFVDSKPNNDNLELRKYWNKHCPDKFKITEDMSISLKSDKLYVHKI